MYINFPEIHPPIQGLEEIPIPNMVTVRQLYDSQKIEHVKEHMQKHT